MKSKSLFIKVVSSFLLSAVAFSMSAIAIHNSKNKIEANAIYTPSTHYTFGDGDTYYNGIGSSLTGDDLLSALQSLNSTKRQTTVTYSSMGTDVNSSAYIYTDYVSATNTDANGAPYGNQIRSFYTYASATSWNREHVWPNSHGGGKNGSLSSPYIDADIHMPRPTISSENSSRGNSYFVEGKTIPRPSRGIKPVTPRERSPPCLRRRARRQNPREGLPTSRRSRPRRRPSRRPCKHISCHDPPCN